MIIIMPGDDFQIKNKMIKTETYSENIVSLYWIWEVMLNTL